MKRTENIGSISSCTLRSEDLIPSLLWALKQQDELTPAHSELVKIIEDEMIDDSFFDSGAASEFVNELIDEMNEYCLPYFYFGANACDGADFGFWLNDDFQDEFEGLQVSDLSEVSAKDSGEILVVSDHGNMSLYVRGEDGINKLIWSLV